MADLSPVKYLEPLHKEGLASWDLLERMFNNVNVLNYSKCWLWDKSLNPDGYGVTTRKIEKKIHGLLVHRVAYYYMYGTIDDNMVVDHTCHDPKTCVNGIECQHRRCYNPYHLRLITRAENTAAGANPRINVGLCRNNLHEWIEENVRVYPSGKQVCIPCQKEQIRRKRLRKVGA